MLMFSEYYSVIIHVEYFEVYDFDNNSDQLHTRFSHGH